MELVYGKANLIANSVNLVPSCVIQKVIGSVRHATIIAQ